MKESKGEKGADDELTFDEKLERLERAMDQEESGSSGHQAPRGRSAKQRGGQPQLQVPGLVPA